MAVEIRNEEERGRITATGQEMRHSKALALELDVVLQGYRDTGFTNTQIYSLYLSTYLDEEGVFKYQVKLRLAAFLVTNSFSRITMTGVREQREVRKYIVGLSSDRHRAGASGRPDRGFRLGGVFSLAP